MKKRTVALLMAAVLLFGAAVGGTLALLTDKTETITNTFTAGKVSIDLTETLPTDKTIKMIPGLEIQKNPTITVHSGSEACYVFVKVEAPAALSTYVTYSVDANNWTKLDGEDNVWYKEFNDVVGTDTALGILTGNVVTIKDVDADTMASASNMDLVFTGYAVQKLDVADAAAAWDIAKELD